MKGPNGDGYEAWSSAIDSARFGVHVVRAEKVGVSHIPALLAFCTTQKAGLAVARCALADLDAARALQQAGFDFVDGELRYAGNVANTRRILPGSTSIRRAERADEAVVVDLARAAFTEYPGHYHADLRLDREAVRAAYVDWAQRCLSGAAADIVLVVAEPEVIAFAAFARQGDDVQLVLGCVAAGEGGRGLYSELTQSGIEWARNQGAVGFFAITGLANTAAQRSWAHAGLLPAGGAYTFHRWFE